MASKKATELSNPPLRLSTRLKTPSICKRDPPAQLSQSQASKKLKRSRTSKQKQRLPVVPEPPAASTASDNFV
jgi:hypothetical protein